jgi:hypothetical protein
MEPRTGKLHVVRSPRAAGRPPFREAEGSAVASSLTRRLLWGGAAAISIAWLLALAFFVVSIL